MSVRDVLEALGVARKSKEEHKRLYTPWGERLDPSHVLEEHPRPSFMRDSFISLNGFWSYAITKTETRPDSFDGRILVPFSPEAPLSGAGRTLMPGEYLWYERMASLPEHRGRWLLHLDAVDYSAVVYINGKEAARHLGGYLPFTVDITEYLDGRDVLITLSVQDPSDTSYHSRGKQKLRPGGIYYTAQSGIWQTVWLEAVPDSYIRSLSFDTTCSSVRVSFSMKGRSEPMSVSVHEPTMEFSDSDEAYMSPVILEKSLYSGECLSALPVIKHWSPSSPWLYPVDLRAGEDSVRSYFALRELSAIDGRILLNGEPLFLNGVLDQGYWPDGLYTAPSDDALVYDILQMKRLGFNMLRKHAKLERARWYYHADRLGMLVLQDMVNGGDSYPTLLLTYLPTAFCVPGARKRKGSSERSYPSSLYRITGRSAREGREEFRRELEETVSLLSFHPSIICWGIFNEGWGQFDTARLTSLVRELDSSRFVDSASGWFDCLSGDFKSVHNYFRRLRVYRDTRMNMLSEYGGSVFAVDGHVMMDKSYGYHTHKNAEEFESGLYDLMAKQVFPLIRKGLCGAVYTQLSDIEGEMNGLVTYDRKSVKVSEATAGRIKNALRDALWKD